MSESASSSPSPRHWQTAIVVVLTLGLLIAFAYNLDLPKVGHAIASAHLGYIALAVLVTIQTYIIRTWRWQVLLLPIGRPRFRTAFRSTMIGFTANFVLPGRVGEVLRAYLLARQEHLSAAAIFATVIIERFLDLCTVLLLFAFFLFATSMEVDPQLKALGGLAAAGSVSVLIGMAVSAGHPERLARWAGRFTHILPAKIAALFEGFVRAFIEGLAVMRRPGALLWSLVLSIPLWLSLSLGVWLTSRAFDVFYPFSGTFGVMAFLTVGIAMPTPGGVGGFHWAYKEAVVRLFHAAADPAAAAAIVLHVVSTAPVALIGLVFMAQDGLTLTGLKQMKDVAREAERTP